MLNINNKVTNQARLENCEYTTKHLINKIWMVVEDICKPSASYITTGSLYRRQAYNRSKMPRPSLVLWIFVGAFLILVGGGISHYKSGGKVTNYRDK